MDLDRRTCDRARRSRDPRFDGQFFICVTTTGIYCRPICPSRTSKDEHVRYVATAVAAQAAGFRPCLRCRPEASPGTPAWRGTSSIVSRALRLISEGALDQDGVDALAERLGVTARHLGRLFVRYLGATPFDVGLTRRAHFAKKLIDETAIPFEEVAFAAGFGSVRRFNEDIRRAFSRTPTQLRRLARHRVPAPPGLYRFRLAYRPPYDWHAAMRFLDAHSIAGVERAEPARYLRTIELDGRAGTILLAQASSGAALDLEVRFPDTRALLVIVERVRRMFDLAADPAVIAEQLRPDPLLGRALVAHPGIRCVGPWDGFELAVRLLLDDRTLAGSVAASFGTRLDESLLQRVFPSPSQLQDAPLERLGVVDACAQSIRELARAVVRGAVCFVGGDAATLASALASIPGIGARAAEFLAASALDEPDAFDAFDPQIRRGAGGANPRDLVARAGAWRPWRAYAAMLLWQQGAAHAEVHDRSNSGSARRGADPRRRGHRLQGLGSA